MKAVLTVSLLLRLAAIAGLLGLSGCPDVVNSQPEERYSPSISDLSPRETPIPASANGPIAANLAAEGSADRLSSPAVNGTAIRSASRRPVDATVCAHIPNWQRPSAAVHLQQLAAMPRYGDAIYEAPLQEMFDEFRSHPVIYFTTYGLSARIEPINLAGIWPVMEGVWGCYEGDLPDELNAGEAGELWLMNYEFVSLEWSGSEYTVTAKAVDSGLDVVQFKRQEAEGHLPISIVTPEGEPVEALSGDW